MAKLRTYLKYLVIVCVAIYTVVLFVNWRVNSVGKPLAYNDTTKSPSAYTVIVLGASVYANGNLSPILKDRVDTAYELYQARKAKRFLLSGDHGQDNYDEVNAMKDYLNAKGVPDEAIFLDHAGFDTYDSMYRANFIFKVDSAIVVTQRFHLPRALYIANSLNLNYIGVSADKRNYQYLESLERREKIANIKAFWEVLINKKPTYLGEPVPITGDSKLSY
jgi:SanA protein